MPELLSDEAVKIINKATPRACVVINDFSKQVLSTRGGRLGSGMGGLLEALWVYHMNQVLKNDGGIAEECELAWLSDNEYNDFACIHRDKAWNSKTRAGELFRIEAKSMNVGVDESKGHFAELQKNIEPHDLLIVLVWSWDKLDKYRVYPHVRDFYIGNAIEIAKLRDKLHLARGGSFVDRRSCPDQCELAECKHDLEPLNASSKRERLSGPVSTRPSSSVSFAANFGGLVRMLKTDSEKARLIFRDLRKKNESAHAYISFIHKNFPSEERNQYLTSEWQEVAKRLGIHESNMSKDRLIETVRLMPNYQEELRNLY